MLLLFPTIPVPKTQALFDFKRDTPQTTQNETLHWDEHFRRASLQGAGAPSHSFGQHSKLLGCLPPALENSENPKPGAMESMAQIQEAIVFPFQKYAMICVGFASQSRFPVSSKWFRFLLLMLKMEGCHDMLSRRHAEDDDPISARLVG